MVWRQTSFCAYVDRPCCCCGDRGLSPTTSTQGPGRGSARITRLRGVWRSGPQRSFEFAGLVRVPLPTAALPGLWRRCCALIRTPLMILNYAIPVDRALPQQSIVVESRIHTQNPPSQMSMLSFQPACSRTGKRSVDCPPWQPASPRCSGMHTCLNLRF